MSRGKKTHCPRGHERTEKNLTSGRACKTCINSRFRERAIENPLLYILRRYRLTEEEYRAILEKQDGHCALCPETEGLELDHDHTCCPTTPTCGKCNRGLLCDRHNRGLGFFSSEELEAAVRYSVGGKNASSDNKDFRS